MCRNIHVLFNFEPPATEDEVDAAALQYVRKISGFTKPSQANEAALLVLSSFLFLAAAIGIVNAMLMSVHERTREIGTVRALGMRRSAVIRLFVLEGLALGTVAATLGVLAARTQQLDAAEAARNPRRFTPPHG